MTRTRILPAVAVLLLALTGCGGEPTSQQPAASSPTTAAATTTPTAAPTATPATDGDVALAMGKGKTTTDGSGTATVYAYKQPVARSAPRPKDQAGYVWGAVDVKVCISKTFTKQRLGVSNEPWSLVYAEDSQIRAAKVGYESFPEPEYPWTLKELAPGRCLRGWITFPVPGNQRPKFVEWAPEGEQVAPRWVVK